MARNSKANTDTEAPVTPAVPEVLKGVVNDAPTTPPGDAKEQERQAKRAALAAAKAKIAAKAAGNGSKPDEPKADAETPKADAETEPKAEEPDAPAETPKPLTTADKLREVLAIGEGRRDYKAALEQTRNGITAILEDLAKQPQATQPKATRASRDDAAKAKANTELENAMLALMREKGAVVDGTPITLQDVMKALIPSGVVASMKDAKPYNAMVRMRNDGRVVTVVDKAPRQFVVA